MEKKANFPSENQLKKMRSKLSKVKGTFILPYDASEVDRTKYELCTEILKIKIKKNISQRELSKELGVAETRVSEILHRRIKSFTIDRLLNYLAILKPNVKIKIA
jgi:predicted XRE-type DNA-binding protein